uniref:DNA-directed RNA polymerase subunit alpha n=1 Tax=Monopsis alba TaxID=2041135 RepID=A0A291F100_9ASTR|nr:RNA polymerase alpha subunit [Monopsis alba]ATG25789.1 RNA polymerase alpha subunit [Monopsis alba]
MVQEQILSASTVTKSPYPVWKCLDLIEETKRLSYGRFILSPLKKGQAETIGIGMRRALLGEIEGTCITSVKSENIPHEYSTLVGIEESVQEILLNLKEIVLRSFLSETCEATICARGPGSITAKDIISPPDVQIVDNTQHIANLTEPIELRIKLQIERRRGYLLKRSNYNFEDGSYPVDALFTPIRNVNHGIYVSGSGFDAEEVLFIEIWTNGSLTPREAIQDAAGKLIELFMPFLINTNENIEAKDTSAENEYMFPRNQFLVPIHPPLFDLFKYRKPSIKKRELKETYIDQLELPPRVYNCLKRAKIKTLFHLLHDNSAEDLLNLEHFRIEDLNGILEIVAKHFGMDLSKSTLDDRYGFRIDSDFDFESE